MTYLKPILLGTALLVSACGQATGQVDRAEVETIIQEYLMENPEILREAFIALEEKEERAALAAVRGDIFDDPRDVAIGPKDAKVTIVEFFDYNCGYCKNSTDWVRETMDKHPDEVRIVFKELPILDGRTKTSRNAAKAALAAGRQGKYTTMHFSLMNERSLTPERVEKIAEAAGLDMEKFAEDMADPKLDKHIEDTIVLANRIPSLSGTPYFFINDQTIAGANVAALQELLEEELKS